MHVPISKISIIRYFNTKLQFLISNQLIYVKIFIIFIHFLQDHSKLLNFFIHFLRKLKTFKLQKLF